MSHSWLTKKRSHINSFVSFKTDSTTLMLQWLLATAAAVSLCKISISCFFVFIRDKSEIFAKESLYNR